MLLLMTQTETIWFHVASLLISILFLVLILVHSRSSNIYSARFNYAFWFCIGHIVLWFFIPERHAWVVSFNKQQVFFVFAAAALAGTGWLSDKLQRGGTNG
ncbi:hypothetical protein C2I18_07605 [Paenibacillus sp. PK3_47]|nr:hypothetical protein C2I18_07605 [Paenibacillus sp. PK3_47]